MEDIIEHHMDYESALAAINDELLRARSNYPIWSDDVVHSAAIVCEESGELLKAALEYYYEGGSYQECIKEAVHTAAMAIRFLMDG